MTNTQTEIINELKVSPAIDVAKEVGLPMQKASFLAFQVARIPLLRDDSRSWQ